MKTVADKKAEAREKELILAAKAGVTPDDVKEGEVVPEPAAAAPEIPPAAPASPGEPPQPPDKPVETPPAQDKAPAVPDGDPQPPAPDDYKALYEQERDTRIKVEGGNVELKSKFNREQTARQSAELQNRVLQIGVGQGSEDPPTPANGGAAPPAPAEQGLEEIDAEIKKLTTDLEDQAGEEIAARMSSLSKLYAKREVAAAMQTEIGKIYERYDPVVENVQHDIRRTAENTTEVLHSNIRKTLTDAHTNWEAIVNSEPFVAWVAGHPMAYQYQMGLQPGDSNMGFAPEAIIHVLDEYIAQDPVLQAEKARAGEEEGRRAAAAGNEGEVIVTTPVIDTYGEGEKMLRSEFIRRSQEVKNNIPELNKLVAQMDAAVATGNFVDDLSR